MYCGSCGAQIEDGAAFCPQCGAAQNTAVGQDIKVNIPVNQMAEENLCFQKVKYLIFIIIIFFIISISIMRLLMSTSKQTPGSIEIWDGAQSDLEDGLRAKEATYYSNDGEKTEKFTITYNMDTEVIGVSSGGYPEAVATVLEADGGVLYEYDWQSLPSPYTGLFEISRCGYSPEHYYVDNANSRRIVSQNDEDGKYIWKYSMDGKILFSETPTEKISYSYDDAGRLVNVKIIETDGDVKGVRYTYDHGFFVSSLETSYTSKKNPSSSGIHRYKYEYDGNGNLIQFLHYNTEGILREGIKEEYDEDGNPIKIAEYEWISSELGMGLTELTMREYDENGNLLLEKSVEGYTHKESDKYYKIYKISQYNPAGKTTEESTVLSVDEKEYTLEKKEYKYDKEERLVEINSFALFSSDIGYDGQMDLCIKAGNSEMHIVNKIEYKYKRDVMERRETNYSYEANKDYSIVNLTDTRIGEWREEVKKENYWIVTYYTDGQIEQYLHDKEFSPIK